MSTGEDGAGCRWLNRTRRGQVREEGKANRSRKNKFILDLHTDKLCFIWSCNQKSDSFQLFFSLTASLRSECCFSAPAAVQAWAGDCRGLTRAGQFVSNLTPTYWHPHTLRLETTCGGHITVLSAVSVQHVFALSPERGDRPEFRLWVNECDESGETRLLKSSWRMLCIGADDSEPTRLADRKKDNCRREMSTSTLRGRDIPDLLSVITPQTYLACSAL